MQCAALAVCSVLCPGTFSLYPNTTYTGGTACGTALFDHNVTVPMGSSLVNFTMSGSGQLILTGGGITLENVNVEMPILVIAEAAEHVHLHDVTCPTCTAAMVVHGALSTRHSAVSVDGLKLTNVSSSRFSVALAHAKGSVACLGNTQGLLVQPLRGQGIDTVCNTVDLSTLLNVYGMPYIITFMDGPPNKTGLLTYIIKLLLISIAVTIIMLYLSVYHVWRALHRKVKLA